MNQVERLSLYFGLGKLESPTPVTKLSQYLSQKLITLVKNQVECLEICFSLQKLESLVLATKLSQ